MSNKIKVTVTTPKGLVIDSKEIISINVPGQEGDIGIYDDHSPLISTLRAGIIDMKISDDQNELYFVKKGIVEIQDNNVDLIVDFIESKAQIDLDRAEKAKKRAEERLSKKAAGTDLKKAHDSLNRAEARLFISSSNL